MPRYNVEIQEIHVQVIEVEAEDPQAAQAAAEEVLTAGVNQDGSDLPDAVVYKDTVSRDEWRVWE